MNKSVFMSAFLVKLLIILSVIQQSYGGENYLVGGALGWGLHSNVEKWSKENTFIEGDTLVFLYEPIHSVLEVNEAAYNSCRIDSPISVSKGTLIGIKLEIPGMRYFICGTEDHCNLGLKMSVTVDPIGTPMTAPPPTGDDDNFTLPPPAPPSHHHSAATKVGFYVFLVEFVCFCCFLVTY